MFSLNPYQIGEAIYKWIHGESTVLVIDQDYLKLAQENGELEKAEYVFSRPEKTETRISKGTHERAKNKRKKNITYKSKDGSDLLKKLI